MPQEPELTRGAMADHQLLVAAATSGTPESNPILTVQAPGAMVALGHTPGLQATVVGVETGAQRQLLAGIDCDAFQGYLFGHPVSAADLTSFLCKTGL